MPLQLNILVIGPSRSGKSCLIASMMSQLQHIEGIRVTPEDENGDTRRVQMNRMKDIFSQENVLRGDWADDGLLSTMRVTSHEFAISAGVYLKLKITEIPSSYLENDVAPVADLFRLHEVVFVTLDTPVLMEGGFSSANRNQVGTITDLLVGQWSEIAKAEAEGGKLTKRQLIFVPLKSEKYFLPESEKTKSDINAKIKDKYAALLDYVHTQEHIKAFIVHARTIGGLVFDHFGEGGAKRGEEHFSYMQHMRYNPIDCEQPFIYALDFALKQYQWPTDEELVRAEYIHYKILDIISKFD